MCITISTNRLRRWALHLGIWSLTVINPALAQPPAPVFLKGPYLQAPGPDTMTIMWESWTNTPGIIHFGLRDKLDQEVRLEVPWRFNAVLKVSVTNIIPVGAREIVSHSMTNRAVDGKTNVISYYTTNVTALAKTNIASGSITNRLNMYEITINNLRPSSVYSYVAEVGGICSLPKRFKTLGSSPRKVKFIAYGDSRSFPKIHAVLAQNFKKHSPDFILHLGDLVASGTQYELWGKEFFTPLASVMDEVPLLAAIGNHEDDGTNFFRYLHLPGQERWYSFDAGPVHVLALDYRFEKGTGEQFRFASQDLLACRAPWKIVMLHYPVFNVGGHDTAWGHEAYLPLFHKAKVDLILAGHSHLYERFEPVAPITQAAAWPITQIVSGGGGAELTTTYMHPALVTRSAIHHYTVFEVTRDTLRGRALSASGALLDAFELKKSSGQPPRSYFARAYPEEWLNLSFDAANDLVAKVAAVPTTTNAADAMFTLVPMKTTSQPVELEIALTPQSAPYYILENGPLRVTTPAPGVSNKVVWAKLLATGKKKVRGAVGQDLSPPLVFQAKVKIGTVETVAYGQTCHVSATAATAAKKLRLAVAAN